MNKKGFALIFNIILIGALLLIASMVAKIVYSSSYSFYQHKNYTKAFYLAEAAVEFGKAELHKTPNYYTDIKISGDTIQWLKLGAIGKPVAPGAKLVILSGKPEIYGVGHTGSAYVIIKYANNRFEEL